MTLNDLVKRVKVYSHRGNKATTTDDITENIIFAINDARRDLTKELPKRWLHQKASSSLSVVQSPATYSLASDVLEAVIFHFNLSSQFYKLEKIDSEKEWFDLYDPNSAEDTPTHYREIGLDSNGYKQIELFPNI